MDEYFKFLQTITIGLAPLIDTPYNRCRSDVKAIEYSAHGALRCSQTYFIRKSF